MKASPVPWPNGARVAVAVSVLFETWSDGKAPSYSVQTTSLKPGSVDHAGVSWASYGGKEGIWRLLRTFERHAVPATFFANARCVDVYPDAIQAIVQDGHDLAGHGMVQDGLLTYMDADEEHDTIRRSLDLLASATARPVTGWLSPVLAFTPRTADLLADAGLKWHSDINYADRPHVVDTRHGRMAGIPNSEFTDNRVLRSSPRDLVDVYKHTFDYLYAHEAGSLMVLAVHCHFGGRPMIAAALDEILTHVKGRPDVWIARHEELADWALASAAQAMTPKTRAPTDENAGNGSTP